MTVIRHGNMLYLSPDGISAAPREVVRLLHSHLSYDHRKFLYGWEARDPVTGQKRKVEVSERRLYGVDTRGRLFTTFGFLHRIHHVLKTAGYHVLYDDLNKKYEMANSHPRPDRYKPDIGNVTYHFKFRQRQDQCLAAIASNLCGVVHAVTGFGKMAIVAMTALLYPRAKIHVITKRLPLVNKLSEYLTRYIPGVGQFGDGVRHMGSRVTVFCAKSLHHSDFDADIVLADEAHELLADESASYLSNYQSSRNYGLTATPEGRADGGDIRLEAIFGRTLFHLPYWEAVDLGLVVPIEVRWHDVILESNPAEGLEDVERKRAGIWFNHERNNIIAKAMSKTPQTEQSLVLTDTIFHAAELYRRVRAQHRQRQTVLVYDKIDIARFKSYITDDIIPSDTPRMTPELKEQYRKMFEAGEIDAIATPTWEVGIDPTFLQHLFVGASFASEVKAQQIPGRASRITDKIDKQKGIINDFRDQFDRNFYRNSRTRYKIYEELRWTQLLEQGGMFLPLQW